MTTSEFTTVLHDQIAACECAMTAAQQCGHPRQAYRHSARLLDLMDRATLNEVDTTGWVPAATLFIANKNCDTNL